MTITIKCKYCGKDIVTWECLADRKKFCNRKCKALWQNKPNDIVLKDDHAEIIINHKNGEVIVLIDLEDVEKIKIAKWQAQYDKTINDYYIHAHERNNYSERKIFRLHRFLMNTPEGMECDHINRNPKDNRKCNLRNVEPIINKQNKGFYKNNKSGYKYIHWDKRNEKWVVEIKRNNVKTVYGRYEKLEDAIQRRNKILKEVMPNATVEKLSEKNN